jgi:hypothetical protein
MESRDLDHRGLLKRQMMDALAEDDERRAAEEEEEEESERDIDKGKREEEEEEEKEDRLGEEVEEGGKEGEEEEAEPEGGLTSAGFADQEDADDYSTSDELPTPKLPAAPPNTATLEERPIACCGKVPHLGRK